MKNYRDPKWWIGVVGLAASTIMASGAVSGDVWIKVLSAIAGLASVVGTVVMKPGQGVEKFPPEG